MPKNLSRHLPLLSICAVCLLSACGQSGALYLPDTETTAEKTPAATTAVKAKPSSKPQATKTYNDRVTTALVTLEALNITGKLAQFNPSQQQSWQALLAARPDDNNHLRYVTFEGDVLNDKQPLTVLVGHPQNKKLETRVNRSIAAGRYLRVRSLETGVNHIPTLIAVAKDYLKHTANSRRKGGGDFLIDTQENIDLFIAVEAK